MKTINRENVNFPLFNTMDSTKKAIESKEKKGIVNIHGKEYMTVARRVELAHEDKTLDGVETEVLSHVPVVIKATITLKGKVYTGISSVDPLNGKMIEKSNPYEVAETSAVGRALGFAGYGIIESIATADEIAKSPAAPAQQTRELACEKCGEAAIEKEGTTQQGKHYHGIFCTTQDKSHTRWLWN